MMVDASPAGSRDQTPRARDQQVEPPSPEDYIKSEAWRRHVRITNRVLGSKADQIDTILQQADLNNSRYQDVDQQIESRIQDMKKRGLIAYKLNKIYTAFTQYWKSYSTKTAGLEKVVKFREDIRTNAKILDDYVGRRVSGQDQIYTYEQAISALEGLESSIRAQYKGPSGSKKASLEASLGTAIELFDTLERRYNEKMTKNLFGRQRETTS